MSFMPFITKTLKIQVYPDRSHYFISLSLLSMNFIQNEYVQDYVIFQDYVILDRHMQIINNNLTLSHYHSH